MDDRWQKYEEHAQQVKEEEEQKKLKQQEEREKKMKRREKLFQILQRREDGILIALQALPAKFNLGLMHGAIFLSAPFRYKVLGPYHSLFPSSKVLLFVSTAVFSC